MAVGDTYVFPGFLTPVLTQLFFPKPPTTFLTCVSRGGRQKYARKKSRLNQGSNSQPPGHESDTLTTEPPGRGTSALGQTILFIRDDCHRNMIHSFLIDVYFYAPASIDRGHIVFALSVWIPYFTCIYSLW